MPAHHRPPPTLALLVWITVSGTLPVHIFVPALPALADYFHASAGEAQLTVTLYLPGIAIGQLIYGPLRSLRTAPYALHARDDRRGSQRRSKF